MNVSRLVASVAGYAISTADNGLAFHLYGGFETCATIGGRTVEVREASDYPWSGDIQIAVEPDAPASFAVKLRIPGWTRGATIAVNGVAEEAPIGRGYATILRTWRPGDVVALHLPMPPERLCAHPRVRPDVGRVALRRGPLIYCLQEASNPGGPVQPLTLPLDATIAPETREAPFEGIVTLTASAERVVAAPEAPLYAPSRPASEPAAATTLPYFLWANRAPGSMQVWVAETEGRRPARRTQAERPSKELRFDRA